MITRLRTQRFRTNLLPFVLAALALRAFTPTGFMPQAAGGFSFTVAMCSPTSGARETLALPGEPAKPAASGHCDFCSGPTLAGLPSPSRFASPAPVSRLRVSLPSAVAFIATLERAQSARAPPVYL